VGMTVEKEVEPLFEELKGKLLSLVRHLSKRFEESGYADIEYRSSDQYLTEIINEGGHLFAKDGSLHVNLPCEEELDKAEKKQDTNESVDKVNKTYLVCYERSGEWLFLALFTNVFSAVNYCGWMTENNPAVKYIVVDGERY
jgi:hypothetical protein